MSLKTPYYVARRFIGPYSSPDRFEFEVYKYFESRLWDLPAGREAEERLVQQNAQKCRITAVEVNNVEQRIAHYYEFPIQKMKPGYRAGEAIHMT